MPGEGKLDVLIVDDEPLARNRLQRLCERIGIIKNIGVADGGSQAVTMLNRTNPDVLLLDIDMPGFSGMQVGEYCQRFDDGPEIIFTTAHSKYAVDAFRVEAADYLLKPVKEALLVEGLDKAHARLKAKDSGAGSADFRIWVQDGSGAVQIQAVEIERIEAERDYMRVCLSGRHYLLHETMQSLADRLPENLFVRIHRSTMIRRDLMKEIRREGRRKFVVLEDETALPIGPSYTSALTGELEG